MTDSDDKGIRGYAAGVAAFGVILHFALTVASFGLISLLANIDVIPQADAGVLLGPSMIVVGIGITWILWLVISRRVAPEEMRVSIGAAVGIGLAAFFAYVLFGATGYAIATGKLSNFAGFLAQQLMSPFAIVLGLLSLVLSILYLTMLSRRAHGSTRPEWPWEGDNGKS